MKKRSKSEALFARDDMPTDLAAFSPGKNSVHFDKSESEEVVITAQTDSKGVLIFTDTYYPGWKSYVNGKQQHIYKVNNYMRGVILDAGISNIIFRFEPDIFTAGFTTSAIAALASLFGIIFFSRRRQKRNIATE